MESKIVLIIIVAFLLIAVSAAGCSKGEKNKEINNEVKAFDSEINDWEETSDSLENLTIDELNESELDLLEELF